MLPLLLMLWLSVVPKGEILVKGAAPSASDASTPVPERGSVSNGRYRNGYFGLTYPIPAGWKEQPAGPPPSDGGSYVLTQFALTDGERVRANVLVTAQDLFFSARPLADARELVTAVRHGLEPHYQVEDEPAEVTIAGRTFHRFSYRAPRSGLRWRMLTTDARCHALTFTFTGIDDAALDAVERGMSTLALNPPPLTCLEDYKRVVEKTEPLLATNRYNTIPVRVIIDRDGRVKHVHLLSAFPEQSQAILAALKQWRFEPYRRDGRAVEVETGLVFGLPRVP